MEFFNGEKYGFVSYSHKDSKKVVPIVQRMSAMGYRIWYDEALPYLEDYNEVIGNALNDSSVFIVFLTRNSVESKYVRSEIYRACDLGKPVCAVMLEKCELPQGLALRLAETNQIRRQDFSDEETFFSCICSVVEKTGCRGYVQTAPQTVGQSDAKDKPEPKQVSKPPEQKKTVSPSASDKVIHEDKKSRIIAVICCVVLLAVIGIIGGTSLVNPDKGAQLSFDNSTQTTSSVPETIQMDEVSSDDSKTEELAPDGLEYTIENGEAIITGYTGNASELTIPSEIDGAKVTSIGDEAFSHCDSLTKITIPDSVTSIGLSAFIFCNYLSEITVPSSVTSIGSGAFSYCPNLTDISVSLSNNYYTSKDGNLYNKSFSELICCPGGKSGTITIPDSVTSISGGAFVYCNNISEIAIPESVTHIDIYAFFECHKLTEINVSSSNAYYASKDGVLYNKSFSELICCPGGKTGTICIPESVTSIGSWAFNYCEKLTGVTIPNGVSTIGSGAFNSCTNLTEITLPDSLVTIGDSAFNACNNATIYAPHEASYYGYDLYGGTTWVVQ